MGAEAHEVLYIHARDTRGTSNTINPTISELAHHINHILDCDSNAAMAPSQLSQYLLYTAASISAASVAGHTRMGYEVVFPSLERITVTAEGMKHDDGAVAAKIGWLEGNQVFGIMGAF
jgi:hypothetical protein